MTPPESITVDLEHARLLKDERWPQRDAHFWWHEKMEHKKELNQFHVMFLVGTNIAYPNFAAPTAEEILRYLPKFIRRVGSDGKEFQTSLVIQPHDNGSWLIRYRSSNKTYYSARGQTLANAAAEMYLFLISNDLLPIG